MKRDLFVFAGQSNMMGASVYPPQKELCVVRSYEYKHKPRRLGSDCGSFVPVGYPVGEFSYIDVSRAYAEDSVNAKGESTLTDYVANTYFCPAMSNLDSEANKTVLPFPSFSEATAPHGATLAPFLAEHWEKKGNACAYTHIAKGGVSIGYYMTEDMLQTFADRIAACNRENGTDYDPQIPSKLRMDGAADYFLEKCKDFFADAEASFPGDTTGNKCFFWLQGETDTKDPVAVYEMKLEILWEKLKSIGFTHFFCIRVDYFGAERIDRVMQAQENFAAKHDDVYILTRAASYFTYPGQEESEWFHTPPAEEYRNCRDSFFGFDNNHINEKGFSVIASHAVENLSRVLTQGLPPVLEEENIKTLMAENKPV